MAAYVTPSDVFLLARFCAGFTPSQRAKACRNVVRCVVEGYEYVKITGKMHPFYGDGSLSSLLLRHKLSPVPLYIDTSALDALCVVAETLLQVSKEVPLPKPSGYSSVICL